MKIEQKDLDDLYFKVEPTDTSNTYGGESWIDDFEFAEYGLQIGDVSIGNFTPLQFKQLGLTIMNHLMINGHDFEFVNNGYEGEYIKEKL
jgi:hypothetical protein